MTPNGRPEVKITIENGVYICVWEGEKHPLLHSIGNPWKGSIDNETKKCIVDGISGEVLCILKVVKGCSNSVLGNLPSEYFIWSIAGSPLYKL